MIWYLRQPTHRTLTRTPCSIIAAETGLYIRVTWCVRQMAPSLQQKNKNKNLRSMIQVGSNISADSFTELCNTKHKIMYLKMLYTIKKIHSFGNDDQNCMPV